MQLALERASRAMRHGVSATGFAPRISQSSEARICYPLPTSKGRRVGLAMAWLVDSRVRSLMGLCVHSPFLQLPQECT